MTGSTDQPHRREASPALSEGLRGCACPGDLGRSYLMRQGSSRGAAQLGSPQAAGERGSLVAAS